MYALNKSLTIQEETFQDSTIYTIENFFSNPEHILEFIKTSPHTAWRGFTTPNGNGSKYKYKKIFHHDDLINPVIDLMMPLFKKGEIQHSGFVLNDFFLYDREYNDYKNKYFWPHRDFGWTGVVYLNDYDGPGTNLYTEINPVFRDNTLFKGSENAWLDKNLYKLEKVLYSKFNRCVFFDAFKYMHNMAVDDDMWFQTNRYAAVIHFKHEPIKAYNHGL